MRPQLTALLTLADEKLRAAGLLVAGGAWGDASSRAYYAAFHAVSAALLSRGETHSRHGQVLGAFNRAFVHTIRRFSQERRGALGNFSMRFVYASSRIKSSTM